MIRPTIPALLTQIIRSSSTSRNTKHIRIASRSLTFLTNPLAQQKQLTGTNLTYPSYKMSNQKKDFKIINESSRDHEPGSSSEGEEEQDVPGLFQQNSDSGIVAKRASPETKKCPGALKRLKRSRSDVKINDVNTSTLLPNNKGDSNRSPRSLSPSLSEAGSFCESEVSFCMSSFESRRRKNEPLRIAIEGNIAAGKSTFIKILEKIAENDKNCHWYVQPEPLAKWTSEKNKNGNLLENFYKNPKRWAYTFEAYTFISRMKQALDADRSVVAEMEKLAENNLSDSEALGNSNFSAITFFERSVYSSRMVFAENCYESGDLGMCEWSIYCDWSNYLIKSVKVLGWYTNSIISESALVFQPHKSTIEHRPLLNN